MNAGEAVIQVSAQCLTLHFAGNTGDQTGLDTVDV